mmetsp:Transcript_82611/g.130150  ORF Transcript_82611/g.130150 Transcript_82611/m.130150 type:complete len:271 (-) Transcript_82611:82-894(-)
MSVITDLTADTESQLFSAFGAPGKYVVNTVALDAEGVDLSRLGVISIVQLATTEQSFIFDVLGKSAEDPLVAWLRCILEDSEVTKIIHDCRMDSDALHHHLNIRLTNVHDTSCWHNAITGVQDMNLNDTLIVCGLPPNTVRDKGVYDRNHAFWATRPLTRQMIEWAVGDLFSLFALQKEQLTRASEPQANRASSDSELHNRFAREASVGTFKISANVGRFIGPRGSSIRSLQKQTNTLIYGKGRRGDNFFMVYYTDELSHQHVLRKARNP